MTRLSAGTGQGLAASGSSPPAHAVIKAGREEVAPPRARIGEERRDATRMQEYDVGAVAPRPTALAAWVMSWETLAAARVMAGLVGLQGLVLIAAALHGGVRTAWTAGYVFGGVWLAATSVL